MPRLPGLIDQDEHLDVLLGAAGCIASLIALYRCAPSPGTLAAAIQCGEHLLAQVACRARHRLACARKRLSTVDGILAWSSRYCLVPPATCRPHGDERFHTAARAALAYEQSLFSAEVGNWPDLRVLPIRESQSEASFLTTWCHGAAGVGMARLRCLSYVDGPGIRADIAAALRTTQTSGFGGNHSLCHGDLGNIELFLEAWRNLGDPLWRAQAYRAATMVLASIGRSGWRSGTPLEVESPGLMIGLAGIGYELLRLADPARVPSVLLLDPPTRYF